MLPSCRFPDMDITKGSLDYISGPASKERSGAGSTKSTRSLTEVGRVNRSRGSLEQLSSYVSGTQAQSDTQDAQLENMSLDQDSSDEENADLDLQKAMKEINRLDRILTIRMSQEKEVKWQRRKLHQKLWQELKGLQPRTSPECSDEVENTRQFLELTSSTSEDSSEEEEIVPVVDIQVPDESNSLNIGVGNEEVRVHTLSSGFLEEDDEMRQDKQINSRQITVGQTKHRQDFAKKNIELAGRAGGLMMMIKEEKERLEELIRDLESESTDNSSTKPKDLEPRSYPECSDDIENTCLYLELTSSTSKDSSEEDDVVPVFETQVPDESNVLNIGVGNEEVRVHTVSSGFLEEDDEVRRVKQTNSRQITVGQTKHRQDFVKRNIELAGRAGGLMMTQKEKERLEEILNDESYDDPSAKPKPGEGYQPDEAEIDQLVQIDTRLRLLLPPEDFLAVRSPCATHILSQSGHSGSDGEGGEQLAAGQKAPQELMEARDHGECLLGVQQQLQERSQQVTSLPEEQLRSLLAECEMAQSSLSGSGAEDFSSPYCTLDARAISLLIRMPRLTSRALSDLLQESSGAPNTPYQCEEDTWDDANQQF
ncbi:fibrous sheath-interacting protein 1 isoform X2 [Brachyhypopomus gauderio]|uniref:fibrous sheath-interacting protein 1 isoform X2 n=1 Tax=Brachyhypopomus gauderio TaxID=698409 RepID=UPI004042BCEA